MELLVFNRGDFSLAVADPFTLLLSPTTHPTTHSTTTTIHTLPRASSPFYAQLRGWIITMRSRESPPQAASLGYNRTGSHFPLDIERRYFTHRGPFVRRARACAGSPKICSGFLSRRDDRFETVARLGRSCGATGGRGRHPSDAARPLREYTPAGGEPAVPVGSALGCVPSVT